MPPYCLAAKTVYFCRHYPFLFHHRKTIHAHEFIGKSGTQVVTHTHTLAIIMLSMIAGVLRGQNPGNLSFGTPAYAASGVISVDVYWKNNGEDTVQTVNIQLGINGGYGTCILQDDTRNSVHSTFSPTTDVSFPSANSVKIYKNGAPNFLLPTSDFKLITISFRDEPGASGTVKATSYPPSLIVPPLVQINSDSANYTAPASISVSGIVKKVPTPNANCSGGANGGITGVTLTFDVTSNNCYPGTMPYNTITSTGEYEEFVSKGFSYIIKPFKFGECECGLDSADIEAITSYILGTAQPNLQQLIAADFSANDTVTMYDIVQIRKCKLGISQPPSGWMAWRFLPVSQYFNYNPPSYTNIVPKVPTYTNTGTLTSNSSFHDFYGVKRGDVNQSCSGCGSNFAPSSTDNRAVIGSSELFVEDRALRSGEEVLLPIKMQSTKGLVLLNAELYFDNTCFDVLEITNGDLPGHAESEIRDAGTAKSAHFMWFPLEKRGLDNRQNEAVFYVRLRAKKDVSGLTDLVWQDLQSEHRDAFVDGGNGYNQLYFSVLDGKTDASTPFSVKIAGSNPVRADLLLALRLDQSTPVEITLHDTEGHPLRLWEYDLGPGYHNVTLSDLPASPGVYFVMVQSPAGLRTLRFIKI